MIVDSTPEGLSVGEISTLLLAIAAILISIAALRQTSALTKRNTLLAMHERLASEQAAEGRRLIHEAGEQGWVRSDIVKFRKKRPGDWDRVNFAITQWNTLAQYARLGMVEPSRADQLWGDTVKDIWPSLEPFVALRREARTDKWSSLVHFALKNGAEVSDAIER